MTDRTLPVAPPEPAAEAAPYQRLRAVLEEARAFRAFLESLSERVPSEAATEARCAERRRRLERVCAHLSELRTRLERAQQLAKEEERLPPLAAEHLRATCSLLLEVHWLTRQTAQRGRTAARLLDALAPEGERLEHSADALRHFGLETGSLVSGRALVA